jgi:membrane protein DedA with SNARE-associated domain
VSPQDVDAASDWFGRNGGRVVFFGRMVPAIRTLISIPAGVARMPLPAFLVLTTAGSALWTGMLAIAGWLLQSQYARVENWVNPVSTVVIVGIVLVYVARLVRVRRA